jgi:hypothetical protein
MYSQLPGCPPKCLDEVFTRNTGMIRIEIVFLQQAEDDLVQESFVGMPEATARVGAAGTAEAHMCMRILLAMQGGAERNQMPGIYPWILITGRYSSKVAGHDLADVRGNLAGLPAAFAEAVKPQVLLRLVERIGDRIDFQRRDGVVVLVHSLVRAGDRHCIRSQPPDSPGEHVSGGVVNVRLIGVGHGHELKRCQHTGAEESFHFRRNPVVLVTTRMSPASA